jgi:hypothetical protein
MIFIPKVNLYHFAETELKPFGIILSHEKARDSGLSLKIEDSSLSVKKIPSANIANIEIKLWGLYNDVSVEGVVLSNAVKSFAPTKIKTINLNYNIFNPLEITAYADGAFGIARGTLSVLERKIHIDLEPSKIMKKNYKSTLRNLKRVKGGGYVYDKNI